MILKKEKSLNSYQKMSRVPVCPSQTTHAKSSRECSHLNHASISDCLEELLARTSAIAPLYSSFNLPNAVQAIVARTSYSVLTF
jgi:hypothetical protein